MKKYLFVSFTVILLVAACKRKSKKETTEPVVPTQQTPPKDTSGFFPVLSFLKAQVAEVQKSVDPLRKITYDTHGHSDTAYINRAEFVPLTKDFTDLPDISGKEYKDRFTEDRLFDASLNRAILTYKPVDASKEEIQQEQVLISPDPSGDKMKSIIIDRMTGTADGSVEKKLLWQVGQSFQVTVITEKKGQPDKVTILKVFWNERNDE